MKTFPKTTHQMADLLLDKLDFCKGWKKGRLLEWVQWFANNGRCYAVTSGGSLVGVTLVRLVDREADCEEQYRDTNGPVCYVEAAVSRHPKALKSLFTMMLTNVGKNVKKMAWVRHKYDGRVTVVDIDRAKRRLMRN
jgi:hypothetical protein